MTAVGALVAVVIVTWLLGWLSVGETAWFRAGTSAELFDIVRSAVTTVGVLGVAIAGALAYQRQRLGERENAQQLARDLRDHQAGIVAALRSRFTTAASQLADQSLSVPIAGVYAMAGIADEWLNQEENPSATREAQICVDVLCAYLRTKPTDSKPTPDVEIRQTIVRVIAAHYRSESTVSWTRLDLDLTGAVFLGDCSFRDCDFTKNNNLSLRRAHFLGYVDFLGAKFGGGTVSFAEAEFSGSTVNFTDAAFSAGNVRFDRAVFSKALVYFDGAKFSGSRVYFGEAKFSGSTVRFFRSEFTGGLVDFDASEFQATTVDFADVKVGHDARLRGPWRTPSPTHGAASRSWSSHAE